MFVTGSSIRLNKLFPPRNEFDSEIGCITEKKNTTLCAIFMLNPMKQFLVLISFFFLSVGFASAKSTSNEFLNPFTDTLAYNFFSPNNDSYNDTFLIENINDFRDYNKLSVFNRWGDIVYEASPYKNDWLGECNQANKLMGPALPEGVYYYRFEYEVDGKKAFIDGKIILKR